MAANSFDKIDFELALSHLRKDKKLATVIDSTVLPPRTIDADVYSSLLGSIVSQQLSVKAAATIHGRFLDLFSNRYPAAEDLLAIEHEVLRSAGLSNQKAKYVKNVATYFKAHDLFERDWSHDSDEYIIKLLTEIKGVGTWTVQMILMFSLQRPDVFPVLDLGIQKGMKKVYPMKQEKKELHARMEKQSKKWKPYRTIACLYFWELA